jgi:acyl-CoA synthetase (AMP-forming)/AMP-acid ligase II
MQKYGTSEFGSPRSRSMANDQLWLKLGSEDFQYKVVENILWVKASTTMLGYLNASSPRTDSEGWVSTEDEVEVQGDWIRILGRKTETIIVGGEKVFPSEVESIILELNEIEDVVVKGEFHPITGQIVTASVKLRNNNGITSSSLAKSIRTHCRERLQPYKVPVKVHVTDIPLAGSRHKKIRG